MLLALLYVVDQEVGAGLGETVACQDGRVTVREVRHIVTLVQLVLNGSLFSLE